MGTTHYTRGNGHKLKQVGEIPPECKKTAFNCEDCQTLEQGAQGGTSREAVEPPSLQTFKTQLDIALGNLL